MEELASARDLDPNDIIIPVMGITGSGKSTFIARCIGNDAAVGHGLTSYTKEVSYATFKYKNRTIRLIDTPGFDDSDEDDSKIFKEISYWLLAAYAAKPPLLLSGIIYLHAITNRMKGTSKSNLAMFQALCGPESWSSVVMATTMWSIVDPAKGEEPQTTLSNRYWKELISAGAKVVKHEDTAASALAVIDRIIEQDKRVVLRVQHELSSGKELLHTEAGQELNRKLNDEREAAEKRLAEVRAKLDDAQKRSDVEDLKYLFEYQTRHQKTISEKDLELQRMRMDLDMIIKEKRQELQMAEQTRTEQDRVAQEQYSAITKQLEAIKLDQREQATARVDFSKMISCNAATTIEMAVKKHERQAQLDRERYEREMEELRRAQEELKVGRKGFEWTNVALEVASVALDSAQLAAQSGDCQIM